MKKNLLVVFSWVIGFSVVAEQVPSAIVYGPKGAFSVSAPKGWVIDNSAGAPEGLPCVLYRQGASWEKADPLMYGKIASTDYEDAEAFARKAIEEMTKDRGAFKVTRVRAGKTKGGQSYFINEYGKTDNYARIERVGYVQLPRAVAYFVYSGEKEKIFRKEERALQALLDSFISMDVQDDLRG